MDRAPLLPPDIVPHRTALPTVLSIPHSGRDYPDWLIACSSGGRAALESLGDPFVDRLAGRAIAQGHGAVIARAARAAIDCNRAADDIDPAFLDGSFPARPTRRARAGLGVVAQRTATHGHLWTRRLPACDLVVRLDQAHRPFHRAIEEAMDRISVANGQVLLLDCHSMPPRRGQAELVIGNLHGRSAADWISCEAARIARDAGWSVAVNQPYAGGYIAERHGHPHAGRHTLQLEICRAAYLDRDGRIAEGFDRASRLIARLASDLGAALLAPHALAAE